MAEIYVQSSNAIQGVIDELTQFNADFRTKAEEINSEKTNLTTKWEGDASTTFSERFDREYPSFENFAKAIDEYVQGLTNILAEYDRTEDANKAIAQS